MTGRPDLAVLRKLLEPYRWSLVKDFSPDFPAAIVNALPGLLDRIEELEGFIVNCDRCIEVEYRARLKTKGEP